MTRLIDLDATSLAELTRRGDVSCREVVTAHLERIEAVNDELGAVTLTLREAALARAGELDCAERRGPLHGVPFTVKEDLDCLGSPTTHGVPALRDALPYADAPIVERLKAAGAIPIARTNTSEMGLRLCTSNPLRGRTHNPYARHLTAGGSSGGDAVAVAAGMTPLGIGSDLGGSLRVPAHCAGVVALKPTTGRIPHASSLEPRDHGMAGQAMLAVGPLARSLSDVRAVLRLTAGRDPRDPASIESPLAGPPPSERRAALVTRLSGRALPPETTRALERAAKSLAAAGWSVEEADPPELARVNEIFAKLLATDLSALVPLLEPVLTAPLVEHLRRLCRAARLDETSNYRIHSERSRLMREWSAFFADYPVIVGPTWATPVWPRDADLDADHGVELLEDTVRFITPGNVCGLPAAVLPMGNDAGLPTSVQLYADRWREDLCLEAALAIEADLPLRRPLEPRRPPSEPGGKASWY